MATRLKIMTFNLRLATDSDGGNSFTYRKPRISAFLKEANADVIGFQEITPLMREWLVGELSDYYTVGGGREADCMGESSLIAFRKDRMMLLSCDTVMLSNAPHVFGSRYDGSDQSGCPREYVRVLLKHRDIAEPFLVYNVHTDHIGPVSRMLASAQLLQDVTSRTQKFFLTGDFNAMPDAPEIKMITATKTKAIKDATATLGGTFHNYGHCIPPLKIDYVFTNADTKVLEAVRVEDTPAAGTPYISDHNPVYIVAEL